MKNSFKNKLEENNEDIVIMKNEFTKTTQYKVYIAIILYAIVFLFPVVNDLSTLPIMQNLDWKYTYLLPLIIPILYSFVITRLHHQTHELCHWLGSKIVKKDGKIISRTFFLPIGLFTKKSWIFVVLMPFILHMFLLTTILLLLSESSISLMCIFYLCTLEYLFCCSNDIATVINLMYFGKDIEFIQVLPDNEDVNSKNVSFYLFRKNKRTPYTL